MCPYASSSVAGISVLLRPSVYVEDQYWQYFKHEDVFVDSCASPRVGSFRVSTHSAPNVLILIRK